jgi:hypothetical protein
LLVGWADVELEVVGAAVTLVAALALSDADGVGTGGAVVVMVAVGVGAVAGEGGSTSEGSSGPPAAITARTIPMAAPPPIAAMTRHRGRRDCSASSSSDRLALPASGSNGLGSGGDAGRTAPEGVSAPSGVKRGSNGSGADGGLGYGSTLWFWADAVADHGSSAEVGEGAGGGAGAAP